MISMEKIHHRHCLFTLLLLLLLLLYSSSNFLLLASGYTLPSKYFINCGSSSNATADGRIFVGDVNSGSSYLSAKSSEVVSDGNPQNGTSPLYQTARLFRSESSYKLQIAENGTYLVRFHFYPFSNLTGARFSVSVPGYPSLLSDFSVQNRSAYPVIKEFAIPILVGTFTISFAPQKLSFAFVNAVEAFLAPGNFTSTVAYLITPAGQNGSFSGFNSAALHVIYRLNVGGRAISPSEDTLWRSWATDDDYLSLPGSAINSPEYSSTPNYSLSNATKYSAPEYVYKTSKELNTNYSSSSGLFNATWNFKVNKNSTYFVRAHFCDVISNNLDGIMFNFSIDSQFSLLVYSYERNGKLGTPLITDYVVRSDNHSDLMNISIGNRDDSPNKTAFLNGLEIMELISGEPVQSSPPSNTKKTIIFIIVGCVGGVLVLSLILLGMILKYRKASHDESEDFGGGIFSWITDRISDTSVVSGLNLGLKIPFSEILYATHRFDRKLMIGEGGFGRVYRGTLRDGKKVAVKRSQPGQGQGLYEFQTEILVLTKIRHRHLVSLIGYCDERREMILVYEFMENGTLRELLYDSNEDGSESTSRSLLSWERRLEICIAAALGLEYLHRGAGIIHRDVKSTNILLDENYVAKVADFGLSKASDTEQTHVATGVKGSLGYLDPEYLTSMLLTQKSDVYSFGVVLLEVLCARPVVKRSAPREEQSIVEWAISWKRKGQLENVIDPFLVGKINPNSLRKFGETAEKCLRESADVRPTMSQVVWDLRYALDLQQSRTTEEGYADSITGDSFQYFPASGGPYLPSESVFRIEEDEVSVEGGDGGSEPTASEVFSQLGISGAR